MTSLLKNAVIGLSFLVAFIPLYVNNSLFFPFITGKAFVFRVIVEIMVALWLILLLRDRKYAPKFSAISLAVTLFMVGVLVVDLAGLNPLRSIWSNFERMEGWVTIVHLWGYFIVTTSMFGTWESGRRMWHNLFNVSLFAAFIVGIYGLFQLFGWAEIHQGSTRIDATLGNAAYMAVYMLMHSFIAFYMTFVSPRHKNPVLFWLYTILGVLFAFLLFETATRGTILGFVGGGMLALAIYAVFGKHENENKRRIAGGIIILIILAAFGLVRAKETAFVKGNETLNRLASISLNETKTQARGYIWPVAVRETLESPKTAILGVGQENFNYIFNANYNPEMWRHEQWFDRAHNVFLDWLVAGGILGLGLYLALFVLTFRAIWKSTLTFKEKCLLIGLVVGYAIHNVFVFDNLISYIMFFMVLGFAHSLRAEKTVRGFDKLEAQSENGIVLRDYVFAPIVIILLLVTVYFVNVRPLQANTRLIDALRACSPGGTPSAELFAEALALNQYMANQEIREQLISCSGPVVLSELPETLKMEFYNLAKKEVMFQTIATPNDARAYVLAGGFFNLINDWNTGLPLLEKAAALSPQKQTITFELATNYMNTGKEQEASVLLEQAYRLAPENRTAAVAYVVSLIMTKQDAKTEEVFAVHPDIRNEPRVLGVYARTKQFPKVIAGYQALIAQDPMNLELHANLAAAYIESGRVDLAIAYLENLKTKFPAIVKDIDTAIQEIRAGKR